METNAIALRAGVGRVTITPPIGMPMIGFAGRGPADGVHDDLTATALVVEGPDSGRNGTEQVAIIACDLLFLYPDEVHAVHAAVSRLTGIPVDHVVVACSHTHYGPTTDPSREEEDEQVRSYLANLVHLLAGAVALARGNTFPCRLSVGQGSVQIGINRRERTAEGEIVLGQNPTGPFDPRVLLLRVDASDGRPLAAVLNYACHPVSLGHECTHITADFPGVARRLMEEQTGATCLFLQGAAGNINPLLMGWDWTHPARLGLPLGAEAARVYWSTTPERSSSAGLAVARTRLDLPPMLPPSIDVGDELLASLEAKREQLLDGNDEGELWWTERRLSRARRGVDALLGRTTVPPIEAEVTAIRLGDEVALVTAPGEIFTEIGQAIVSRSPFRHTLYAGYTDGSIGYVPARRAYAEGGYEVTHACDVAPEAGELLEEESVRLLRELAAGPAVRNDLR